MSTNNLCFEQKYEKYQKFLSEHFHFYVVKFSFYLNRRVFVMMMANTTTARYNREAFILALKIIYMRRYPCTNISEDTQELPQTQSTALNGSLAT